MEVSLTDAAALTLTALALLLAFNPGAAGLGGEWSPPWEETWICDLRVEVYGWWRHDPLLGADEAGVERVAVKPENWRRDKPSWTAVEAPSLGFADKELFRLDVILEDREGRVVYRLEGDRYGVKFKADEQWSVAFYVYGAKPGTYRLTLKLYQYWFTAYWSQGWTLRDEKTYTIQIPHPQEV